MKRSILITAVIAVLLFLDASAETKELPQSSDIPQVSVSPTSVKTGETVTVTVTNGPGAPTDYVGVFTPGSPAKYCIDLLYLNGSKKAPSSGLKSATVSFATSTLAGAYEFRLYANNTWNLLAKSPVVTVNGPTIELVGDPVVISDKPRYCAFTDMVRLAGSGDLLAVYFAGANHMDGASSIVSCRSTDDGKTWGAPATLVPSINSGYGVRDPHIVQLPNGTLLLNYFSYPEGENSVRAFVISSTDNGQTWSKPDLIDVGAPSLWVATCGKILVLKSGTLLLPLYFKLQNNDGTVGTLRSRDGGKTWEGLVVIQKNNTEGEMEVVVITDAASAQTPEIAQANITDIRNLGVACITLDEFERLAVQFLFDGAVHHLAPGSAVHEDAGQDRPPPAGIRP